MRSPDKEPRRGKTHLQSVLRGSPKAPSSLSKKQGLEKNEKALANKKERKNLVNAVQRHYALSVLKTLHFSDEERHVDQNRLKGAQDR